VHQRRRATAIRSALGASRLQLLRHHFRTTGAVMLLALPLGAALAAAASPLFGALVFGVVERDPASLWLATLMAGCAGLAGTLVPASRGAQVDPILALHGG
jgi:ABC-type antimicrobial peptide transport system permease subunit